MPGRNNGQGMAAEATKKFEKMKICPRMRTAAGMKMRWPCTAWETIDVIYQGIVEIGFGTIA